MDTTWYWGFPCADCGGFVSIGRDLSGGRDRLYASSGTVIELRQPCARTNAIGVRSQLPIPCCIVAPRFATAVGTTASSSAIVWAGASRGVNNGGSGCPRSSSRLWSSDRRSRGGHHDSDPRGPQDGASSHASGSGRSSSAPRSVMRRPADDGWRAISSSPRADPREDAGRSNEAPSRRCRGDDLEDALDDLRRARYRNVSRDDVAELRHAVTDATEALERKQKRPRQRPGEDWQAAGRS
jgi:hypothetical protein